MFDCHVHTTFSTDSKMKVEDARKQANELDIGIIITEHMDLLYPDTNKFYFDVEDYLKTYEAFRGDRLLLGMEMGMRSDCIEENKKLIRNNKLDYIIGSIHLVNGIDIYESVYYEGRSKKEAYEEYFSCMLKCVKLYDFVDSLGHIDYIARYARVSDVEIYYNEYREFIDEILKTIIKNNIALEINTRRLNDKKALLNLIEIHKRFRNLGGKFVTIGSDSHRVDDIGKNFKIAEELAENCGLKIVHFKEREMIMSK